MMDELQPVKEAIREGHLELARNLLRVLIENYPDNADVWYWAAQASVNETQRKAFLEKAVLLDPLHHRAANALIADDMDTDFVPNPAYAPAKPVTPAQPKLAYAGFGRRAAAVVIDFTIVTIVASPFAAIFLTFFMPDITPNFNTILNDTRLYAVLITLTTIIQAIYYGYFLSQQAGQTLGKRLMKIRVLKLDGTALSVWEAVLRNVIGYQLSNIILGVGFLWMFTNKNHRTWHDMVVDTIVVDVI